MKTSNNPSIQNLLQDVLRSSELGLNSPTITRSLNVGYKSVVKVVNWAEISES